MPKARSAPRPVKTGAMAGTDFIVDDGLKGGEQVIVNGLQKARPGHRETRTRDPGGSPAHRRPRRLRDPRVLPRRPPPYRHRRLLKRSLTPRRRRSKLMFAKFFIDRPIFAWVIAMIIVLPAAWPCASCRSPATRQWRRPALRSPSTTRAPRPRWSRTPWSR
jgi:hypothetical protein